MDRQVDEQKRGKQTNGQTGGQTKKGQTDKRTDPLTRGLLYRFISLNHKEVYKFKLLVAVFAHHSFDILHFIAIDYRRGWSSTYISFYDCPYGSFEKKVPSEEGWLRFPNGAILTRTPTISRHRYSFSETEKAPLTKYRLESLQSRTYYQDKWTQL